MNISEMIEDCDSVKNILPNNGGPKPKFDAWEKKFLTEIIDEYKTNQKLDKKKLDKLKEMWDRI